MFQFLLFYVHNTWFFNLTQIQNKGKNHDFENGKIEMVKLYKNEMKIGYDSVYFFLNYSKNDYL